MKLKRNYGVEIECFGPSRDSIASVLTQIGLSCVNEPYSHNTLTTWKTVPDGSVHNSGYELVSPILSGEDGFEQIKKVVKVLKDNGAQIDKSCGFHVHVDGKNLTGSDLLNILKRYEKHEHEIDMFMTPNRRLSANKYCRTFKGTHVMQLTEENLKLVSPDHIGYRVGERYYKLNVQAFLRHGTVEFRQHHGTLDAEEMIHWIKFCINFVEKSIRQFKKNENLTSLDKEIFQILLDGCTCNYTDCRREKSYVYAELEKFIPIEKIPETFANFHKKYGIEIKLATKGQFDFYRTIFDERKYEIEAILEKHLVYINSNPKSIYAGLPEDTIAYYKQVVTKNKKERKIVLPGFEEVSIGPRRITFSPPSFVRYGSASTIESSAFGQVV